MSPNKDPGGRSGKLSVWLGRGCHGKATGREPSPVSLTVRFAELDTPLYNREKAILSWIQEHRMFYRNALKSPEFRQMWETQSMVTDGAYVRSRLANAVLSEPELESCSLLMMRTFALATMDWIEDSHGLSIDEYVRMMCNYLWYGLSGVGQSNNTLLPEPITVQGRL